MHGSCVINYEWANGFNLVILYSSGVELVLVILMINRTRLKWLDTLNILHIGSNDVPVLCWRMMELQFTEHVNIECSPNSLGDVIV